MIHPNAIWRVHCKHCGEVGAVLFDEAPQKHGLQSVSNNFFVGRAKVDDPGVLTIACKNCRKGVTLDHPIQDPKGLKWALKVLKEPT